ncbi:MAG: amidohydrolase [Betaproteobacteria bacterium]|nr:MAG: amidohydrolase [Betaproteobacteria bacterium]
MNGRKTMNRILSAGLAALGLLCSIVSEAQVDERKQIAFDIIERNADQIATVGDVLYYHAELGMQELESTKFLQETLEAVGFKVEMGGAGFPTHLWAQWGSGKPLIVIVTEIDALPEGSQTPGSIERKPLVKGAPGHMEGHNTHGAVAVAAAYAVKRVMELYKLPGTVAISFGPAEEQLVSRPFLVRAGLFKDADAALIIHIGDNFSTGHGLQNYAAISAKFTFHGKTAHGAVNPWEGRDAVDAVELMDMGFDKLREHLRPSQRAHRTITIGGIQPNIIPDLGQIWWFVRDANAPWAKENFDKLVDIARGAALMTGTTMEMEVVASAWPQLGNRVLAEAIQKNIDLVGNPKWSAEEEKFAKDFQSALGLKAVGLNASPVKFGARPQAFASNDSGDVTWNLPTGNLNFPASVPGVNYHNWQAAVTPTSSIAHKGEVAGAKVLAASLLDLLTSPALVAKAKEQFREDTRDTPYFSFLPADAKPPLELNREMMERFRPEMRKHYLNRTPQFN